MMVTAYHFINLADVRQHCSAGTAIPVSVMKCCCTSFSFCNPWYPSYSTCSEVSLDQSIYFHFNKPFHTVTSPASVWQRADKSYIHTYRCSAVANKNTVNYQVCSETLLLSVSSDAKHNVCIFHKVFYSQVKFKDSCHTCCIILWYVIDTLVLYSIFKFCRGHPVVLLH